MSLKVKAKIVKDVTQLVLARRTKMCNFLEYKGACFPYPYPSHRNIRSRVTLGHLGPLIALIRVFLSFFRYQGCIQAICFPFLCVWDLSDRQRTRDAGDRPSLRRSPRSVFRKRESRSFFLTRSEHSQHNLLVGLRTGLVSARNRLKTSDPCSDCRF